MPITGFDHLNIRTMNVEGTLTFFRDLLGMGISPLPGRSDLAMGGWVLDPAGQALIHVNHGDYGYPTDADFAPITGAGSGPVHHLALKCAGRLSWEHRAACVGSSGRRRSRGRCRRRIGGRRPRRARSARQKFPR